MVRGGRKAESSLLGYLMQNRADLHRHLDGSLREKTVHELAEELGFKVPKDLFFKPHMDLHSALSYFGFTLSLLQNTKNIKRVASEICEDAKADGVDLLEVRFGPHLHLDKGLRLEEVIDSALEGLDGKAGLILCGLYGDDPKLIESFVDMAITRSGVVALDLAGGPTSGDSFCLEDYKKAYTKALDNGIGRTVHASEGRPPEEIIKAIEVLHAQRIGHGVTLLDSARALDLVLEKGIVIEACPTSNLQCGVIPSHEEHPLGKWLDLGVKACLNTDNTFFSQVSSSEEHQRALSIEGMNEAKLGQAIENGLNAGFHRS